MFKFGVLVTLERECELVRHEFQKTAIRKAFAIKRLAASDRRIASVIGVSQTTAGSVRKEMEEAGTVSKLDTRVGKNEVEQPATKPPKSVFAKTERDTSEAEELRKAKANTSTSEGR